MLEPFLSPVVVQTVFIAGSVPILAWLAWIDIAEFRLPDTLVAAYGFLGAALSLAAPLPGSGPLLALAGAILAGGLFSVAEAVVFARRRTEGLGLGDVKFAMAAGLWFGPVGVGPFVLIAAAVALTMFCAINASRARKTLGALPFLPFGPALCFSALILSACSASGLLQRIFSASAF